MKKIAFLFLILTQFAVAQHQCTNVISSTDFSQKFKAASQQQSDKAKYKFCSDLLRNRCFLSNQIKQLAQLFNSDDIRLQFTMEAFIHVYDKPNFYDVYDAFKTHSATFKLHDFVNGNFQPIPPAIPPVEPPPPAVPPVPVCTVTQKEFEMCKSSIENEPMNSTKVALTKQILQAKKCFTCVQIKTMLGWISFETSKLEIAKFAFEYCRDTENYFTVAEAFTMSSSKEDLLRFINGK